MRLSLLAIAILVPAWAHAQTPAELQALRNIAPISTAAETAVTIASGGGPADLAKLAGSSLPATAAPPASGAANAGAFAASDVARLMGTGVSVVRVEERRVAFLQRGWHGSTWQHEN